mmetsp:Transcript_88223/g.248325  ORF Transcript_88223/g.248325 Transcript_88223/m.248325 type:complete len:355 (-) Transcript_88223:1317-2381(-)
MPCHVLYRRAEGWLPRPSPRARRRPSHPAGTAVKAARMSTQRDAAAIRQAPSTKCPRRRGGPATQPQWWTCAARWSPQRRSRIPRGNRRTAGQRAVLLTPARPSPRDAVMMMRLEKAKWRRPRPPPGRRPASELWRSAVGAQQLSPAARRFARGLSRAISCAGHARRRWSRSGRCAATFAQNLSWRASLSLRALGRMPVRDVWRRNVPPRPRGQPSAALARSLSRWTVKSSVAPRILARSCARRAWARRLWRPELRAGSVGPRSRTARRRTDLRRRAPFCARFASRRRCHAAPRVGSRQPVRSASSAAKCTMPSASRAPCVLDPSMAKSRIRRWASCVDSAATISRRRRSRHRS